MIRLGPAKWDLGNDFSLNHYLDGYAMLCKFSIRNDYVNFQTKYLYSDAFCKMVCREEIDWIKIDNLNPVLNFS